MLTLMELKFIADTSELLNSCVDKKFMQSATNVINPDIFSMVYFSFIFIF